MSVTCRFLDQERFGFTSMKGGVYMGCDFRSSTYYTKVIAQSQSYSKHFGHSSAAIAIYTRYIYTRLLEGSNVRDSRLPIVSAGKTRNQITSWACRLQEPCVCDDLIITMISRLQS